MDFETCFQLGYVIKVHGLKGEVQIYLDVDIPSNYKKLESVFVDLDKKLVPFFVESIYISGNKATVKFEEVNDVESAASLKSKSLYLPIEKLPSLPRDQFYFHEIVGYTVHDQVEGSLGTIKEIYSLPHQDLIGMAYNGKEVLIPLNDKIIKSIDHQKKELKVVLPDGLLQIYLED